MVAAAIAALTIYDMSKALDKGITIESVRLLEKSGGKSGAWSERRELSRGAHRALGSRGRRTSAPTSAFRS